MDWDRTIRNLKIDETIEYVIKKYSMLENCNVGNSVTESEHDQIITVEKDGRVVIVSREGNKSSMVGEDYFKESNCRTNKNHVNSSDFINIKSDICDEIEMAVMNLNRETEQPIGNVNTHDKALWSIKNSDLISNKNVANIYKRVMKAAELLDKTEESVEDLVVDKLTCLYCSKTFSCSSSIRRHIRKVHNKKSVAIETHIRCMECDISFTCVDKLRLHLNVEHDLNMTEEELRFPDMNAFKQWKCEIERKHLCSYILKHGKKKNSLGPKYLYRCHRSGRFSSTVTGERQRMFKVGGTCKLGIVCTAGITCQICPSEIIVKYVPHHYGHGKDTSFVQLSPEEQIAIEENVLNGVPEEDLLVDIRDSQSKDTLQLFLLKKRDFLWIKSAFNAEEYNLDISDAESVMNWVKLCSQMEDSPVLLCQQKNIGEVDEEFILVIMTEFQKQILFSSHKEVICVDALSRRRGMRFYLTVIFVMDEFDNAFPVAFCISDKTDKNVMNKFFISIKESVGSLTFNHFMSDCEQYFYDTWVSVMNNNPKWLWSTWYIDDRIKQQLRKFKGNIAKRDEVYKTVRKLLECQNKNVFTCMFKNFITALQNDAVASNLGKFMHKKFASNTELWSLCYRKEVDLTTNIYLEVMHHTFRQCCKVGMRKRLDKFLFVVMKLVKFKMLDRIANTSDQDKLNLAVNAIDVCHTVSLNIPIEDISFLSENVYIIKNNKKDPVYVVKEMDKCPEHCNLKCDKCDVCVHQYSCSCISSMLEANLCMHIHAVVWKFINHNLSPLHHPFLL